MKLSVIIPTINESDYIPHTIRSVRKNSVFGKPLEIIVVDSNSIDGTQDLALELEVCLILNNSNTTGRAAALNKGAEVSTGDVLLFLDADTLPPPGYDKSIWNVLRDNKVVGGAFEFALDGEEFGLRVVELINRLRYRIGKNFYGDQGIFVRRDIFMKIDGYPSRSIMEASHFCNELKKVGKTVIIPKPMKTSPRRFVEGGVYRVLALDIKLWFLNLIGVSLESYVDSYWEKNMRRGETP